MHETKRMGKVTQDVHVLLGKKTGSWKSWKISAHKGAYILRLIILQPGLQSLFLDIGMTATVNSKGSVFEMLTTALINTQSKHKGTMQKCE